MNWQKLRRTLVREFQRSPGKTCLLLALLPVAAYFIVPLLGTKEAKGHGAVQPAAAPVAAAVAAASVPGAAARTWHELVEWMANDVRMRTAPHGGARNPFRRSGDDRTATNQDETAHEVPEIEAKERPQELSPSEMGLRLTATIVGSRVRMATINGRRYREQAPIAVGSAPADDGVEGARQMDTPFVVKTISRKHVVLERNGKLYPLEMAR